MNNPIQFLEIELIKLTKKFVQIQCSYEFHNMTDAHYVEISPASEYDKDELKYSLALLLGDFYELFPGESLIFLTEGDGVNVVPSYQVTGNRYIKTWNCLMLKSLPGYIPEPIQTEDQDEYSEHSYALAA
jgi:hypothetical protein